MLPTALSARLLILSKRFPVQWIDGWCFTHHKSSGLFNYHKMSEELASLWQDLVDHSIAPSNEGIKHLIVSPPPDYFVTSVVLQDLWSSKYLRS